MLNIKYPLDEHNIYIKTRFIKNMLMKHTKNDSISLLYMIFSLSKAKTIRVLSCRNGRNRIWIKKGIYPIEESLKREHFQCRKTDLKLSVQCIYHLYEGISNEGLYNVTVAPGKYEIR